MLEAKERLLETAKRRIELEKDEDRYRMPDASGETDRSKKYDVLKRRYDTSEDGDNKETKTVQQEWEEAQGARAKATFGAQDRKKQEDEYELRDQLVIWKRSRRVRTKMEQEERERKVNDRGDVNFDDMKSTRTHLSMDIETAHEYDS